MSKPYVIGMDMGGTNTVFGIVDARGQVIASDSVKTKKHAKFEDYIADLHQAVTRLLEANDAVDKIKGIGIGAPNGKLLYRGDCEGSQPSVGTGSASGGDRKQGIQWNPCGCDQ